MKKKDIVSLVISILIFLAAGYFGYRLLFPPKPEDQNKNQGYVIEEEEKFTGVIDEETLKEVKKLQDYGEGNLENIGRINPFGSL